MSRSNPVRLLVFLCAVLAISSGLILAKGGLLIARHEGDTLHLLDILARMAGGQRIHSDFMTPIGVLAFAPMVPFLRAGEGYGHALIHGQLLAAAVILPAVWWTMWTRLSGFAAYLTGLYLMVLATALTYGGAEGTISMSMHYNRWAWALAYVAVLLAVLPPKGAERPVPDGIAIGLAMAGLGLLKVTYLALAVPVVVALALRPARRTLAVSLLAGLAAVALVTVWGGGTFWLRYLRDVMEVAASETRASPGLSFGSVLGAPAFLGVSLLLLFAVVILRQTLRAMPGLVMLLLGPAFAYITYQNWGNDPQWLILVAVLLFELRPAAGVVNGLGWDMRQVFHGTIVAALAFAAPSFLNLAYSPYRHLGLEREKYVAMLPDPRHGDLMTTEERAYTLDASVALDGPGSAFASYRERIERKKVAEVLGEELPICELSVGLVAYFETMAADLAAAGYAGKDLFETDLLEAMPLYGDFRWVRGGAPWHYGGAPGLADADYVLVPECPLAAFARKLKLDAIAEAGIGLREVRRTELYRLYEKVPG